MTQVGRSLIRVAFAGMVALSGTVVSAQTRTVDRPTNVRILDMLLPNETALIVMDHSDSGLLVLPEVGVSQIDWLTQGARAVLIVEVSEKTAELTSDEEWIVSAISASVVQVLKMPSYQPFVENQVISFFEGGGDLIIGTAAVSARLQFVRPLEPGHRYLMFLNVAQSSGRIVMSPRTTYELTANDGLASILERPGDLPDELETTSASAVIARIQHVVAVQ